MYKKVIVLIVLILIIVVVGIIAYINLSDENTGTNIVQSQTNNNENEQIPEETRSDKENAKQINQNGKILVLYFSQSGNTETVANFIHEAVGGDIVKLETEVPYPNDYDELVDYAQEEQRRNARPTLKTRIDNIDEYDTIFLGYPNWWQDCPMPIYTFLDEYDLSGKKIAPFITHGGSGLSGTPDNIQAEEPNATVTEGLAINGSNSSNAQSTVNQWLSKIGF